jgi:hypothetical protein
MKNTPFKSILDESFDHMFVVDKDGKMVFFPWGSKHQGYYLKRKYVAEKVKRFYRSSFFTCVAIGFIAGSIFQNGLATMASMLLSFGVWYLVYYLYASRIVRTLPVAKSSHTDIVLEKLESKGEEEWSASEFQFPSHWNQPVPPVKGKVIAQIEHFWYRLSPSQIFMVCAFGGMLVGALWALNRPEQWIDADSLVGFLVCLLIGYGSFVFSQHLKSTGVGWLEFKQFRLGMALTTVTGWALAAWFLYQFVVLVLGRR